MSALSKRIGNIRALVACIIGWAVVGKGLFLLKMKLTR